MCRAPLDSKPWWQDQWLSLVSNRSITNEPPLLVQLTAFPGFADASIALASNLLHHECPINDLLDAHAELVNTPTFRNFFNRSSALYHVEPVGVQNAVVRYSAHQMERALGLAVPAVLRTAQKHESFLSNVLEICFTLRLSELGAGPRLYGACLGASCPSILCSTERHRSQLRLLSESFDENLAGFMTALQREQPSAPYIRALHESIERQLEHQLTRVADDGIVLFDLKPFSMPTPQARPCVPISCSS